mgnify:FL=1|jgi:hypothetical protein
MTGNLDFPWEFQYETMNKKETMKELIAEANPEAMLADGFDDALIGYTDGSNVIAVYDRDRCVSILNQDMPLEDAEDYFYYNVIGSYVGEYTPIFIKVFNKEEEFND